MIQSYCVLHLPGVQSESVSVERTPEQLPGTLSTHATLAGALHKLPEAALAPDDVLWSAVELLRRCSLTQLQAIELFHLREAKRHVAGRAVERARAKAAEPDTDEDGDTVAEPTPLADIDADDAAMLRVIEAEATGTSWTEEPKTVR
jgi:hypothetical protein